MNHTGKSLAPPAPVEQADWIAGVTEGNHELRPLLDGEPDPLAFAAKAGPKGWVESYVARTSRARPKEGMQACHTLIPGATRRHKGRVVLVPADRC